MLPSSLTRMQIGCNICNTCNIVWCNQHQHSNSASVLYLNPRPEMPDVPGWMKLTISQHRIDPNCWNEHEWTNGLSFNDNGPLWMICQHVSINVGLVRAFSGASSEILRSRLLEVLRIAWYSSLISIVYQCLSMSITLISFIPMCNMQQKVAKGIAKVCPAWNLQHRLSCQSWSTETVGCYRQDAQYAQWHPRTLTLPHSNTDQIQTNRYV